MPTYENPVTDATEAYEALRGLAHATRSWDESAETYRVAKDARSWVTYDAIGANINTASILSRKRTPAVRLDPADRARLVCREYRQCDARCGAASGAFARYTERHRHARATDSPGDSLSPAAQPPGPPPV